MSNCSWQAIFEIALALSARRHQALRHRAATISLEVDEILRRSRRRSVLVGQTLRRLPSGVEHQASFVDLGNVLCKAVQFSEGDAVTSAVMASTVDHVWTDRGRKDAVDRVQASSAASLAHSCPRKKKRRWRSMQTGPSIVYVAISWPARSSCCCCFSWRSLWWLLGGAAARG